MKILNWNKISAWLKLQREGFLVGTGIAVLVYFLKINLPLEIEQTGIIRLAILIFIFSTVGALVDSVWRPTK